jgi:GGDEF-like domain
VTVVFRQMGNEKVPPPSAARNELVRRWRSQKDKLQDAVYMYVCEAAPDPIVDDDADLALGLREVIAVCVDCGLAAIEQGESPETLPPLVAAQARHSASSGWGLSAALVRCIAGYSRVWTFILGEVARCDLSARERSVLLTDLSHVTSSLLARVQAEIADAHSLEIRRRARSRVQRNAEIVHKLLGDEPVHTGDLLELGYDLDCWHLGVIATGVQAGNVVRGLATALGCGLLSVAHGTEAVLAWFGGPRRIAFTDLQRVLSDQAYADISLAVGEPGREVEGWRQTHREAESALLVARSWPSRVTRYLDVATEAMALQDETLGDALIETYLSPLDGMRIDSRTVRRTLHALFKSQHNVSSAASALKVDRSTVHRRRSEIESRLACRLHERQRDIEAALRIEERRQGDGYVMYVTPKRATIEV